MRSLFFTVCALAVVGCSPGVDTALSKDAVGKLDVFELVREPTDASLLRVTDLQMSHMQVKGLNTGSLYLAASGLSDFVEISACHSRGCEPTHKETGNRLVFPPFPNETITIKARACVEPERALVSGVLCGSWKEISWSQPPNENTVLAELLAMREQYRTDLEDMGGRVKDAIVRFEKDLAKCKQRSVAGQDVLRIRGMVSSFANMGEFLISKALSPGNISKNGASKKPTEHSEESIIPSVNVTAAVKKVSDNAAGVNPNALPAAAEALKSAQNASAQASGGTAQLNLGLIPDPVGGLRAVANAVLNVATATEAVNGMMPCFAESQAQSEIGTAKSRFDEMQAKLAQVEAQIQAQGGL